MSKITPATPATPSPAAPTAPVKSGFVRRKAVTVLPVTKFVHLYTGKTYSLKPEWVEESDLDDYFRAQLAAGKVEYVPD